MTGKRHSPSTGQTRMVYAMGFAERLRAIMAERGLSGLAVARKVHCDQSYISRLASGKQRPSQKIAMLLDDAGQPDLLGWAAVMRSLIAYYHGLAHRSATIARHGREIVPLGTVAHARLAAQEMRSRAMLGDSDGMAAARRRAVTAIESLGPDAAAASGAFSIPLDQEPPYTATSLLLVGRFRDAAEVTRRVLDKVYQRHPGDQPAKYARTLLILGLAEAGLGRLEEASAAGSAALECSRPAWPTMVLAERLDRSLAKRSARYTADYHARYIDAAGRLPSRQLTAGTGRRGER
jgi:transcriptional regulator with XRE-family HTH domain